MTQGKQTDSQKAPHVNTTKKPVTEMTGELTVTVNEAHHFASSASPTVIKSRHILALQRTVGNQAVQRLINQRNSVVSLIQRESDAEPVDYADYAEAPIDHEEPAVSEQGPDIPPDAEPFEYSEPTFSEQGPDIPPDAAPFEYSEPTYSEQGLDGPPDTLPSTLMNIISLGSDIMGAGTAGLSWAADSANLGQNMQPLGGSGSKIADTLGQYDDLAKMSPSNLTMSPSGKVLKALGSAGNVLGTLLGLEKMVNAKSDSDMGEGAADTAASVAGFFPGYGAAFSGGYSLGRLLDEFSGWAGGKLSHTGIGETLGMNPGGDYSLSSLLGKGAFGFQEGVSEIFETDPNAEQIDYSDYAETPVDHEEPTVSEQGSDIPPEAEPFEYSEPTVSEQGPEVPPQVDPPDYEE